MKLTNKNVTVTTSVFKESLKKKNLGNKNKYFWLKQNIFLLGIIFGQERFIITDLPTLLCALFHSFRAASFSGWCAPFPSFSIPSLLWTFLMWAIFMWQLGIPFEPMCAITHHFYCINCEWVSAIPLFFCVNCPLVHLRHIFSTIMCHFLTFFSLMFTLQISFAILKLRSFLWAIHLWHFDLFVEPMYGILFFF